MAGCLEIDLVAFDCQMGKGSNPNQLRFVFMLEKDFEMPKMLSFWARVKSDVGKVVKKLW